MRKINIYPDNAGNYIVKYHKSMQTFYLEVNDDLASLKQTSPERPRLMIELATGKELRWITSKILVLEMNRREKLKPEEEQPYSYVDFDENHRKCVRVGGIIPYYEEIVFPIKGEDKIISDQPCITLTGLTPIEMKKENDLRIWVTRALIEEKIMKQIPN